MLVRPDVLASRAARPEDVDPQETAEFVESLEALIRYQGPDRARFLLDTLLQVASRSGVRLPTGLTTAYVNTILPDDQTPFPGDQAMERRIKSLVRWNAMAMVVKANKTTNVGGHIATFASAATLYEIGWNHFFRGRTADHPGDVVFYQGHAAPGMYARAFVEGRLDEVKLTNFRQELQPGGGLSSYPHPWLMPDFWQYPTVSMGLGPIMSIYHARFNRYLRDRGRGEMADADRKVGEAKTDKDREVAERGKAAADAMYPNWVRADESRVWAYLGDGECDEVESLGCLTLAAREKLDNLTWVINCNLQRLDGPVRGNGKIIQELEGLFRGAGWNVLKVVWGSGWDAILKADHHRRPATPHDGSRRRRVPGVRRQGRGVHPRALLQHPGAEGARRAPERRPAGEPEARRARPAQGLRRVQVGHRAQGPADRHPREDRERLRHPGEGGEGMNTAHQAKKLVAKLEADARTSWHRRIKRRRFSSPR